MTAAVSVTTVGASRIQSSGMAGSNALHGPRRVKFSSRVVREAKVKEKTSDTYSHLLWYGVSPEPKDPYSKEGIRIDEALALNHATTLEKEVNQSGA